MCLHHCHVKRQSNRSICTSAPSVPLPFLFGEKRNITARYHQVIIQPANCTMFRKSVNQALFVKFAGGISRASSRVETLQEKGYVLDQILKLLICPELW